MTTSTQTHPARTTRPAGTRRRTTALAAALAAGALVLSACGGDDGGSAGGEGTMTLTLGHAGSETDPRQTGAEEFADLVEEASDGRITVEIFPSSTLGTWEQMVEGLQLGTTDVVIESLLSVEAYTDLASVETAPFLYDSPEAFFETWDGGIGDEIKEAIAEESGYRMLGDMYRGPRQLTTKTPVTQLSDVQGLTIRTPSAPTMLQTWQALGARSEALPFDEVYSALEQGVLDGQENPLDAILFNSIYEVAPEISRTEHMYANYHFIVWDEALQGMSEEDRTIIEDAAAQVGESYTERTIANIDEYETELEGLGATFHDLTDRPAWVEATQPVVESLSPQVQEWITQIRG
ncbi:TRAP transporter substrate-binding protein [Pseudokineococcus sp. 1T1Z-3]|uniref:TRAP transporter substrate-binding protein n=1 Tax=Pseudokineococcus sp. 1T1Z-3 TaxID=3132745 RepID=UPI00309A5C19